MSEVLRRNLCWRHQVGHWLCGTGWNQTNGEKIRNLQTSEWVLCQVSKWNKGLVQCFFLRENSIQNIHYVIGQLQLILLEFDYKTKLQFVKIYFDTPTFDRITKDRRAKFEDIMSAVGGLTVFNESYRFYKASIFGGTMGLLTGFSIISGVEIIFYMVRITGNIFNRKENNQPWKYPNYYF